MSWDDEIMGEVRALLHRPSAGSWAALRQWLDAADDPVRLEQLLLPMCMRSLTRWPKHIVREPLPGWLRREVSAPGSEPRLKLCNALHFGLARQHLGLPSPWSLAASPHLGAVRRLVLGRLSPDLSKVEALGQAPWMAGVERLEVEGLPTADVPRLSRLLQVQADTGPAELVLATVSWAPLNEDACVALAGSGALPASLRRLTLGASALTEAAARALVDSPDLAEGVEEVVLLLGHGGSRGSLAHAFTSPHHYMTPSPGWRHPTLLALGQAPWRVVLSGVEAQLGGWSGWRWRVLTAGSENVAFDDLRIRLDRTWEESIRDQEYEVEACSPEEAVELLSTCEALRQIRALAIRGDAYEMAPLQALLETERFRQLEELTLRCEEGLDEGIVRLLTEPPGMPRLRRLDLSGNMLCAPAARMLAGATGLGQLEELSLADNNFGRPGAEALAVAPWLAQLRLLDVRGCFVTGDCREMMQRSKYFHEDIELLV